MSNCKISILCDNTSFNSELFVEFGLCVLVETCGKSLLFDAGLSNAFIKNAANLGLELANISAVALSHNHLDHTRGYLCLNQQIIEKAPLYISQHFFKTSAWKKADSGGYMMPTTGPLSVQKLSEIGAEVRMIYTDTFSLEGFDNVFLVGNIPKTVDFELVDQTNFSLINDNWVVDSYRDELALVIDTDKGLVLLTGCAHAGICNIIEHVKDLFNKKICAVIGGTHLVAFDEKRTQSTIEYLKKQNIETVAVCHCTGEDASKSFLRSGFTATQCGAQFSF